MVDVSAPSGSWFGRLYKGTPLRLRLGAYAAQLASLGLVVLVGRMLATLVWNLATDPSSGWSPAPAITAPSSASSTIDVNRIAAAHLFGQYVEPSAQTVAKEPAVPLGLDLVGSFYYRQNPPQSRVMIASSDGEEKPYAVGEPIGPNIKLAAIFSDHINIIRDGHLEVLRLDQFPASGGAARNSTTVASNDSTANQATPSSPKAAAPPTPPVMHYGDD